MLNIILSGIPDVVNKNLSKYLLRKVYEMEEKHKKIVIFI